MPRRPGRLAAGDPFGRLAEGHGVRDGAGALGALGQQHAVVAGHALAPLLDPAVLAGRPHVQVQAVLTGRVSTGYSMDSVTPERTGPCGIVDTR
jgi:hypothetical protein